MKTSRCSSAPERCRGSRSIAKHLVCRGTRDAHEADELSPRRSDDFPCWLRLLGQGFAKAVEIATTDLFISQRLLAMHVSSPMSTSLKIIAQSPPLQHFPPPLVEHDDCPLSDPMESSLRRKCRTDAIGDSTTRT